MNELTKELTTIRASATPRVELCAASVVPPTTRIEIPNDAATLGTVVHVYLPDRINGLQPSIEELANEYGVDPDIAARACFFAWSAWQTVKHYFPEPRTDYAFKSLHVPGSNIVLTGTADVISLSADGRTLYVLDFKSGWGDGNHLAQVKTYGVLGAAEFPTVETVYVCVLHIRQSEMETVRFTADELKAWAGDFASETEHRRIVYSPSPEACGFCPRVHECPARQKMLYTSKWLVSLINEDDDETDLEMTPVALASLIERARMLEKACETVRGLVKASVLAAGGELDIDGKRKLVVTHGERKEIDFPAAEGILQARLGDRWREAVSVGKGDVEKIVGELAPPRGKGKAIKALMEELEAADAIKYIPVERLEIRKSLALVESEVV